MKTVYINAIAAAVLLAGCAGSPPAPDWQMNAQSAVERATNAYLSGNAAIEDVEFARARDEVARTGKVDLVLRVELIRCATRVASLVVEPCAGVDTLRQDAGAADLAYADYLAGKPLTAAAVALLPPAQQGVAAFTSGDPASLLTGDPLSRLVGAGVLLRSGRASPAVLDAAVETASSQGWRRPLLAWLGAQASRAEQAGDAAQAQRVRRRMALVANAPAPAPGGAVQR
jgi:hypothetical protein